MMKRIYMLAWILLVVLILGSALAGTLDPGPLLAFSLAALGLVYALRLRPIFKDAGGKLRMTRS